MKSNITTSRWGKYGNNFSSMNLSQPKSNRIKLKNRHEGMHLSKLSTS